MKFSIGMTVSYTRKVYSVFVGLEEDQLFLCICSGCNQPWPRCVLEVIGEMEGQYLQASVAEPGGVPGPVLLTVPHVQVPPGRRG